MRARRIVLWVAVMGVAAAAILLADPFRGDFFARVQAIALGGMPATSVDLSAPVTQMSCAPCHLRIAEGRKPGIIFKHATHLSFQCLACHPGNPHSGGGTSSPPMELCFNCHGVQHGPQGELASSKCRDCHTKGFDLRPRSHTKAWVGKPHAQRGKAGGVNGCMMCHNAPKDCDPCHKRKGLKIAAMPKVYHPIYRAEPRPPSVRIYPDKPTTMGQCIQCHPDIDSFMPGRIIFQHAEHLKRNYACTACHPKFGHQGEKIQRPDMQSCYRCHGLLHATSGQVATEKCDKCHPPGFELKPPDHTDVFMRQTHGARASADAAYCSMCHQLKFCTDCHLGRKTPTWLAPGQKVVPKNHKLVTWRGRHGKLFIQGKGLCASCHDGPSCQACHKTPMPHPPGWAANHGGKDINRNDCNICHVDRQKCQNCHHEKVKRADLVAANCVGCHEQMKQQPPTSIKDKGMAEHAVHFDVAKKKGKPYKCDDCHVELGSSASAQQLELQQGHDLRLCYGCHGGLDYENRLIAPWPGAELCRRCHTDLNI